MPRRIDDLPPATPPEDGIAAAFDERGLPYKFSIGDVRADEREKIAQELEAHVDTLIDWPETQRVIRQAAAFVRRGGKG